MWPKNLVLVRHAESEGNVIDVDTRASYERPTWAYNLTPLGRQQAEVTGKYLHETYGDFDVYYTSYYTRAKQTMQIMYPNARVYEDSRLAEAQRGIYHAMTREEIKTKYPEELVRKDREGLYHYRPPGGENWLDIEMRVHSFLGTLARDYGDQNVIVIIHGAWFVLFEKLIHHLSIEESLRRYHEAIVANASVTVYGRKAEVGYADRLERISYTVPYLDKPNEQRSGQEVGRGT